MYEFASRKPVKRCEGNAGSVIGVAFAAKSDVLVTAHADDSLLAWRMHTPGKDPTDVSKLWDALLNKDAEVAWPAMMALVDAKGKGVAAIADGLKVGPNVASEKEAFELRKQRAGVVLNRIGSDEAKILLKGFK